MEFASITVRTDAHHPPHSRAKPIIIITIVTIVTIVTASSKKHRAIKRHRVMKSKKPNPSDAPGDSNSPPTTPMYHDMKPLGPTTGIAVGGGCEYEQISYSMTGDGLVTNHRRTRAGLS